jgi:hypothetical protein
VESKKKYNSKNDLRLQKISIKKIRTIFDKIKKMNEDEIETKI